MKSYEQKYKDALERAKILLETSVAYDRFTVEEIFPELIEPEGEEIRKEILDYIKHIEAQTIPEKQYDSWIAWLEKQKVLTTEEDLQGKEDVLWCIKQAKKHAKDENEMGTCWFAEKWIEKQGEPTDINPSEFDLHLNKLLKQFETLPKEELASSLSFYLKVVQNDVIYKEEKQNEKISSQTKIVIKKDEKSAAWSEEDNVRLQRIIDFLWYNRKGDTDTIYQQEQDIDWLKSLRPQKQWKPSKEQMKALHDMNLTGNISYTGQAQELIDLYKDLKKLREE